MTGFPPLAAPSARVLVVGSMPGARSLAAGQYYAHPRNAFWAAMGALCGFDPDLAYDQRVCRLLDAGVAVWDVLRECVREGSLDAAIEPRSAVANDFAAFFAAHPRIAAVFCNGAKAHACWRRYVAPQLDAHSRSLPVVCLPSTSPAHASLRRDEKVVRIGEVVSPWLAT